MERRDRAGLVRLFHEKPVARGETVSLAGASLQHVRARRMVVGDAVALVDGAGRTGTGLVDAIGKASVTVKIEDIETAARPMALEILVPVADRDRMLWAAEKCAEFQITSWRPVVCARSRSVSPRGEGPKFSEKVKAKMRGALEQSGSAWMPDVRAESELAAVLAAVPREWSRFVLDPSGESLARLVPNGPTALVVGPEGGLESDEIDAAIQLGWMKASLGPSILRFETAIVAGAGVVRSVQQQSRSG